MRDTHAARERAVLIQAVPQGEERSRHQRLLTELHHLVAAADLDVQDTQMLGHARLVPSHFLGQGQVERLAEQVAAQELDVVVFNHSLSPVQQRNLEKSLKAKVVDRTGIILEIFARRARTREGRLQVELASLMYQQSRLVRSWTHLERQRGGVGMRGGPGEAQIEIDRRLIRKRIDTLKRTLANVARTRALQRRPRRDIPLFTVALVGYTNAGKSTLFNQLTDAGVEERNALFATLDPTVRSIDMPGGGQVVLSDTVGFIRDLPHDLVAAFRATLEEVCEADLLLHVVDISDPEWEAQMAAVMEVLEELEAADKPMRILLNKTDLLDAESPVLKRLMTVLQAIPVSAKSGAGLDDLRETLARAMSETWRTFRLELPWEEGALTARLCQEGRVLERIETDTHLRMTVSLPHASAGRLASALEPYHVEHGQGHDPDASDADSESTPLSDPSMVA
ncbi:MAG: GTPase HflX [Magnetococcales bacterium]|nr:GTPase HflX [Magnetococcales bacterium]